MLGDTGMLLSRILAGSPVRSSRHTASWIAVRLDNSYTLEIRTVAANLDWEPKLLSKKPPTSCHYYAHPSMYTITILREEYEEMSRIRYR